MIGLGVVAVIVWIMCRTWWLGERGPHRARTAQECLRAVQARNRQQDTKRRVPFTDAPCGICRMEASTSDHFCVVCGQCRTVACQCNKESDDLKYLPEQHPSQRDEPPGVEIPQEEIAHTDAVAVNLLLAQLTPADVARQLEPKFRK